MRSPLNAKTALVGGMLASIGASACCVGPLLLLSLGYRWSVDWQSYGVGAIPARLHRACHSVSRACVPTALFREAELRFGRKLRCGSLQ